MDEFAVLDRIGKLPPEETGLPETVVRRAYRGTRDDLYVEFVSGRCRNWDVRVPEAVARRTLDRLTDRRLDWTLFETSESPSQMFGERGVTNHEELWGNGETGATLTLTKKVPPPQGGGLKITVQESSHPLPLWSKIKRWWRMTLR